MLRELSFYLAVVTLIVAVAGCGECPCAPHRKALEPTPANDGLHSLIVVPKPSMTVVVPGPNPHNAEKTGTTFDPQTGITTTNYGPLMPVGGTEE